MPAADRDPSARRVAAVLFVTLGAAYAYFHQGGGWNQNIRFDQVRALAETGRWSVNRYSAYQPRPSGSGRMEIARLPLAEPLPADTDLRRLNSWDISLHQGRIYPNKPPGVTLLALPAYSLSRVAGRLLGLDPDGWLGLTAGLYLTTVLSVGVAGAFGGLLFFFLSRRLFPELDLHHHAAATLAFGLGTLVFPFSTMLFDHVPVAVATLAGFALAAPADGDRGEPSAVRLAAAGATLGFAVVLNYTAVLAVALVAVYLAGRWRPGRLLPFVLGGLPAAGFLAWYHRLAFGHPLATANTFQLARYRQDEGRLLGMLGVPDPGVLWQLLFSEFRGLFVYSPILLAGLYGLWRMVRRPERRPEAALCAALFASFLLLNASFNGWHAGATFGPRYLIPALPFVALPLALAFARRPAVTAGLAALSVLLTLLGAATTPMVHQSIERPLSGFLVPAFLGRLPFDPVSLASAGVYELSALTFFGPDSLAARWNAFNLGEALFPRSRLSLLPLLLVLAAGTALAVRGRGAAGGGGVLRSRARGRRSRARSETRERTQQ